MGRWSGSGGLGFDSQVFTNASFTEILILYGVPSVGALLLLIVGIKHLHIPSTPVEGGRDGQELDSLEPEMSSKTIVLGLLSVVVAAYVILSIDTIHYAGDHTADVVFAPYPTLDFNHGGGEEGDASIEDLPEWFRNGSYIYLYETY